MTDKIRLKKYLEFIAKRVELAEDAADEDECIRLADLIKEVCDEYIKKCERHKQERRAL